MKKALIWIFLVMFVASLTYMSVGCKEEAAPAEEAVEEAAPAEEEAAPAEEEEEAAPVEEAMFDEIIVGIHGDNLTLDIQVSSAISPFIL